MDVKIDKQGNTYTASTTINGTLHTYGANNSEDAVKGLFKLIFDKSKTEHIKSLPEQWIDKSFPAISNFCGIKDKSLLMQAFLHSLPPKVEFKDFLSQRQLKERYKRLATVGDGHICSTVVSYLYDNDCQTITEEKNKIVSRQNLGEKMISLGFNSHVISADANSILTNANVQGEILEAWIGAVYVSTRDLKETSNFVKKLLL